MTSSFDTSPDGERSRDEGMATASVGRDYLIRRSQLRFLRALMASPDSTGTLDDGTDQHDLHRPYSDGGKWRGRVTAELAAAGIIRQLFDLTGLIAVRRSTRPSRHSSPLYLWKLIDRPAAERKLARLEVWISRYEADRPRNMFGDPL